MIKLEGNKQKKPNEFLNRPGHTFLVVSFKRIHGHPPCFFKLSYNNPVRDVIVNDLNFLDLRVAFLKIRTLDLKQLRDKYSIKNSHLIIPSKQWPTIE